MLQAGRIASLSAALALVLIFPGVAAADDRNGDTIVVITGGATVAEGESVDGVFVVDGPVRIAGRVDGDVFVVSGDTQISGEVTGDVTVISEPAVIASSARIGGDLRYGDEKPEIASGAQIDGKVSDEGWSDLRPAGWIGWAGWAVFWFALALSTLGLGLLLLLIAPRAADAAYRQARDGAWESVAAGLAIFILLPLLAVLALVTLVGLPLGIAVLLALLPLGAIAHVTTLWVVGRALVKPPRGRVVAFLAGWAIFSAIALVPFIGILAWLGAIVFGLGVLGLALWRARSAAAPPPEAQAAS
ncbi:MAG TPA: polymer-forming cytoskeletal protein [Solirubrobacterales bacterium]|nr:polymer-forming cytoskeletal protein [Solirubrobacterales bacterium]